MIYDSKDIFKNVLFSLSESSSWRHKSGDKGMVSNEKDWAFQEQNMILPSEKDFSNCTLTGYIFRSYQFSGEVTLRTNWGWDCTNFEIIFPEYQ